MGLTTDAVGRFRPFWTDTRYGAYQVMTAAVEAAPRADPSAGGAAAVAPEATGLEEADVSQDVDLVFDPSSYDPEGQVLALQARLRNIGSREIRPPITLVIRHFGSGLGQDLIEFSPTVLNASNGEPGIGASFDYSNAMGSAGILRPGETSGPVEILLDLPNPLRIPDMHVEIRGRVAAGG